MDSALRVQALYIYPIKSLGGISLSEAEVEQRGFRYDRRWMLVDQNGLFMSQRKNPEMALLKVSIGREGLRVAAQDAEFSRLVIPFEAGTGQFEKVVIWDDEVKAERVGKVYDLWFSQVLGEEVKLVKMPETVSRAVDKRYAKADEEVSFADGMPYLILGNAALNELNSRLTEPVGMDRFRPNIVFDGGEPFAEDDWKELLIGGVRFAVVKPCARCVMTTVDQKRGEKGVEPLRTLAGYRTRNGKVFFGQNALALEGGMVRIGDSIKIR